MKKIRVVVAEDNRNVRQGIRSILNHLPKIQVVGEAEDGREALRLVSELAPDVLLLDVQLPEISGLEVARELTRADRKTRILVVSAYDDPHYIGGMLSAGASGYLLKDEAACNLVQAVVAVAAGHKVWLSPQIAERVKSWA